MCYASQNISEFNFGDKVKNISMDYKMQVTLVVMAIISRKFVDGEKPVSVAELSQEYGIPINMAKPIIDRLNRSGLINYIQSNGDDLTTHPLQPALDVSKLTVGEAFERIYNHGDAGFIPDFTTHYPQIISISARIKDYICRNSQSLLIDIINK